MTRRVDVMVASASEVEYVLAKAPRTNFRWTMALENTIFWTKIPAQGIDSAERWELSSRVVLSMLGQWPSRLDKSIGASPVFEPLPAEYKSTGP
jgi:hypothetical protein